MTDEELEERFVKSYPQFCCNGKPLSPFWDLWEAGAEFAYNKANEWHYVKDGDLPKTKKKVLVLLKDVEEPILDYYRQDGLWNYALENEVIAWKEIVPPSEPMRSLDKEEQKNYTEAINKVYKPTGVKLFDKENE